MIRLARDGPPIESPAVVNPVGAPGGTAEVVADWQYSPMFPGDRGGPGFDPDALGGAGEAANSVSTTLRHCRNCWMTDDRS